MATETKRVESVGLRSLGLDEKWLQNQVEHDPKIIGLGDLEVAGREHRQPVGGRIDFLLRHPELDVYYEVEMMLGAVDESHIIRTIEYWDVERQRRPKFQHKAVIVAEEITARFFNVIRLLNRAVPLIAVKLSAFKSDDGSVVLWPIVVLDTMDEVLDDDVAPIEKADRGYWEKKSRSALETSDEIVNQLRDLGCAGVHATYNKHHIALGTTGYNFCWFYARKGIKCRIELKTTPEARETILSKLINAGIDANIQNERALAFSLTATEIKYHSNVISEALQLAELQSRA